MRYPDGLPEGHRPYAHQVALHEAGHAVAAYRLGFDLQSVTANICEELFLGRRYPVPGGETASSAASVRPHNADTERQRRAAIVAMAGREARRRTYPAPELDEWWKNGEASDVSHALHHTGLYRPMTLAEIMAWDKDPVVRARRSAEIDHAVAPFAEAARELMAQDAVYRAVEALVALLIERMEAHEVSGRGYAFVADVGGEEALAVIH